MLIHTACPAQPTTDVVDGETAAVLDAYMTAWAETGEAGALLVAKDGQILLKKGYGLADRVRNIPNTGDTIFPIGSIVKPLTRIAINQLEAAGKLSKIDPLSKFLDGVPADKQAITLEQLLAHEAGFQDHHGPDLQPAPREETLQRILGQRLLFTPGEDESYSNSGYTLLAAVIENVSGQSYPDYIEANVLTLAGMTRTGFYRDPRWSREEVAVMYDGYESYPEGNSPLDWPETTWALMGNGGIAGPPEDLYRWAQYRRAQGATGPMFAAGGGNYGNVAVLMDFPEHGTLVFMTNTDDDGMEDPKMIEDLVKMAFGLEIALGDEDEDGVDLEALHAALKAEAEADQFSGVVLVAQGGQASFIASYGMADRENAIPNTPDTRFNLGSINKDFTAVAVLQLWHQGKLNLDAPLITYLPEFPAERGSRITVRHLLQHRSGLGHYWNHPQFTNHKADLRTMDNYLAFIKDMPLDFEPGSRQQYSNAGFELLGSIIERVSGQPYRTYVQEHIFEPAGMKGAGFFETVHLPEKTAIGYTGEDRMPNTDVLPPIGTAAGAAYATVEDLLEFYSTLLDGKLVPLPYVAFQFNDFEAFDENAGPLEGSVALAGGAPGLNASAELEFGPRDFVIVMTNLDPPLAEETATRIAGRLRGDAEEEDGEYNGPPVDGAGMEVVAMGMIDTINAGNKDRSLAFIKQHIAPEVVERNTPERLLGYFEQILNDHGQLTVGDIDLRPNGKARLLARGATSGDRITFALRFAGAPPLIQEMGVEVDG